MKSKSVWTIKSSFLKYERKTSMYVRIAAAGSADFKRDRHPRLSFALSFEVENKVQNTFVAQDFRQLLSHLFL